MKNKEKTCIVQPAYKQPNFFLYGILWLVIVFANRIFGVKYDRAQLKAIRAIKGPALIVASHHGPLDFAFLTYAMYPKRLSIVTAANIYYKKGVQRLLKTIKSAIPKKQFTTDYSSVKSIRKMLDAGVSVVVYPEARYSLDGRQGRVSDSIYKLIKWLKVPVVTLKCNMSYQVRPRYVNDFRKGRVIVETAVALSAEECAALTSDEIKARLQPWLTYNDLAYQQQAKQCFKGKKGYAEGLPDLLYKCPKCGAEFAHKARGNYMECAVCGNTVEIDGYNVIRPVGKGSVCPSRIDYWYDYQYNELKKEIISNEDYSLAHKVKMSVSS
ncbi:MAG: lysophospholipid acyltransferase family protein, partial [Clostridia bacterium]|nr:lysophospholipid acyltransferase family protein [Clostridia bacterium]